MAETQSFSKFQTLKDGTGRLWMLEFFVVGLLGILVQYYITVPQEVLFGPFLWSALRNVAYMSGLLVLVRNYHFLRCVIVTLPRDARGAWRFFNVIRRIRWARKNNYTIVNIFDLYANKNPEKTCFYYEGKSWSFNQVQNLSNQIANYFAAKGLKKDDSVSLFMENKPEFVCIWMGLNRIGVCTALINYNLRGQQLLHSIRIVKSKAIIFGDELHEAISDIQHEDLLSGLPIYCFGDSVVPTSLENYIPLHEEIKSYSESDNSTLKSMTINDGLYYIYTSGTTGLPKAAIIKQYRFMMATNGVHYMNNVKENDILYDALPLYHMTGGMVGVGQALLFGTSVVIRKRFSASQFWKDCIKYNVTVAQYLGETCRYLLAQPPTPEEKLHTVRLLSGNGLRHEIWNDVKSRFNIQEIGEVYGSTEGNCNVSNIDSQEGAVGFVPRILYPLLPMTLVKVDEVTGEPIRDLKTGLLIKCKPNEPGELVGKIVKNHPIRDFQGYTDSASTSKKIIRSVFKKDDFAFRTGDILIMDEYGYFYFKDRTGDTYRWKGENVSTMEVESVISSCCSYQDAVVYGVKVPKTEGRAGMVAIADPKGILDFDQLSKGIMGLPPYARPLFLRITSHLDMTGTYKMKKKQLQEEGFNLEKVRDKMYFFRAGTFEELTPKLFADINQGQIRL